MSRCIAILGTEESLYAKDLQRAALELDRTLELPCLNFNDLTVGIDRQGQTVSPLLGFGGLIVRTMPLGSLEQVIFRMDCLQVLEQAGVAVVNPPRSLEIAIDKWLTLHRLQLAGVPVPPTVACQSREAALEAFEQLGGDVVVKPLFGGEGRGLLRVQDKDMAWRVLGSLQQLRSVLYLQQFQEHFGYDIRVLFVGEQHFAIRRRAREDSWRTNLSQGSSAEVHQLTDAELDLARRAAQAVGGCVLGVDLLPCRDGRVRVLEVNAVPGWMGLGKALKVDVAKAVVSFVLERSN